MATIADLQTLGYDVGLASVREDGVDVYHVAGFGVQIYVAADDQAAIAGLADPAAHAERVFQSDFPDAAAARALLERDGYTVSRPDATQNVFTVTGGTTSIAKQSPANLAALVVPNLNPPKPPAADEVMGALASLNPNTASVADVVNAVKSALAASGATPTT